MGPARTMPKPNAADTSDASSPTAVPDRSCETSSRTMPNARGSTPPPTPWTTRATIIHSMLGASAAIADPIASSDSVTTSIFCLPTASPMRPSSGVATAADSRYDVSTQVTVDWSVSKRSCTCDSTGTINDCSSPNAPTPTASTTIVVRGWAGLDADRLTAVSPGSPHQAFTCVRSPSRSM